MRCDRCRNAEAVFHDTKLAAGAVAQRHLCRDCAEAEGYRLPPPHVPTEWTLLNKLDRRQR